jgi:hypothetical protein
LLNLEMNKVIVGQKHMIERLLIGLLAKAIFFSKACRDSQKPRHQHTFASRSRIIQPHSVYP